MSQLLNQEIVSQVDQIFTAELKGEVDIFFFGRQEDCETCADIRQLLTEVTSISDKLHFSEYDIEHDAALAAHYRVDKTPGFVLLARDGDVRTDYGVRFAGIPSGHEFSTLIHDLILVSGRDSGLSPETRAFLKGLEKPVHLQVFVTPT